MKKTENPGSVAPPNLSRMRLRLKQVFWPVVVFAVILIFALLSIPILDGPNSHMRANEAASVGMLRTLNKLQAEYASKFPHKGFACHLFQFKTLGELKDLYGADEFLVTGMRVGYKFEVTDCEAGPDGVVKHYQFTVVPREPGKSGVGAFCSDESGALWYDPKGSATNCLTSRRPL